MKNYTGNLHWHLNSVINGAQIEGRPVTVVALQGTWVYGRTSASKHFHMPRAAFAAWKDDYPPIFAVLTRCGRSMNRFSTSVSEPEGKELCDMCVLGDLRKHVVYRFYDADDSLLYVGYSGFYLQRFLRHAKPNSISARWWSTQVRHTVVEYETEAAARDAERLAISFEVPKFNQHSGVTKRLSWSTVR